MKEIIAIIRPKMIKKTRVEIESLGFFGMTAFRVMGRGKQKGIMAEVDIEYRDYIKDKAKDGGMKYVPKRYLTLVVPDDSVDDVIAAIVRANQTGEVGDGRIFVCPVEEALRVRTGETDEAALI